MLALLGLIPGWTYNERLSDGRGFYLVAVRDTPAVAVSGPRRAVVVVLDGLGYEEAGAMVSMRTLAAHGQCLRTDVGPLSMSRPVYATLSTGLSVDRHGCRGNLDCGPLGAESVWELARRAGRSVAAVSELPWFRELFPHGFSSYQTLPRGENYVRRASPADLTLIHPLYIDEVGHEAGAASPRYRQAVERADRELGELLSTLDLRQDLILVTADHGHALGGGHGGRQRRVAQVLSCYAGRGVAHRPSAGPAAAGSPGWADEMRATSIAPSLALFLGLPFPAHMRAVDDDLDVIFRLADPRVYSAAYLQDRHQAIVRFRADNHAQLRRWSGVDGWDAFYAQQRQHRLVPATLVLLAALVLGLALAGHRRWRGRIFGACWAASVCALWCLGQWALRGSVDLTAVQARAPFVQFTIELGLLGAAFAGGLHLLARRSLAALLDDTAGLLGALAVLCLGHPLVFAWVAVVPMPGPMMYFFPYFSCLLLASLIGLALPLALGVSLGPLARLWMSQRTVRISPISAYRDP